MIRRSFLAALTALAVRQSAVRAQGGPPLMSRPNPSDSCAAPFLRSREDVDRAEQLRTDLIVWSYDNQHLTSAYVVLDPELSPRLLPPAGKETIGGIEFRFFGVPSVPPNTLWMIVADCGQLM